MTPRALFIAGVGIGAFASASSPAETSAIYAEAVDCRDIPPELYMEPVDRAETSAEQYAYSRLLATVFLEDAEPGHGFVLVSQEYELTISEALTLLEGVRSMRAETVGSEPKPASICRADISSAQDYVDWWAHFDAEIRAHRRVVIDALVSAVGASIWESVMKREYPRWLAKEDFGKKINRQAQLELADYRVWMGGMCG